MKIKTDKDYQFITAGKEYDVKFLSNAGRVGTIITDSGTVMNVFLTTGCPLIDMNRWEIIH